MSKTSSQRKRSSSWRQMQDNDGFVREAVRLGARSRSYFKIEEIDRKFKLFTRGQTVLDLGASPGGWSQYASSRIESEGKVFAVDILEMKPLNQVQFIRSDITGDQSMNELSIAIGGRNVDVILSDMAPNITGNSIVDSKNFSDLHSAIFNVCGYVLVKSGILVFKYFQDEYSSKLRKHCQTLFEDCIVHKPKASRTKSQESYFVARRYKI